MAGIGIMSKVEHAFSKQEDLLEALSQSILSQLEDAIISKAKATLLVSGGSTPKPLLKKLSQADIAWDKVSVGLCDERWVSSSHEDSNEKLVKTYLLKDRAAKARFVSMYEEGKSAKQAENSCSAKIVQELYPFDVVILGMGSDAHTASLFPNNSQLSKAFNREEKQLCISVEPQTAPHSRMSLTLGAILSASHLYLHFEGAQKLAVYKKAIVENDPYKMPISSVLNQDIKDVEVYYT